MNCAIIYNETQSKKKQKNSPNSNIRSPREYILTEFCALKNKNYVEPINPLNKFSDEVKLERGYDFEVKSFW